MKWILLLTLIVSSQIQAANFIKGDGSFIAKDGDNHEFIKGQLIHEGIKSILSKQMVTLGLNKDLFWQKYDEKLNGRYSELETQLQAYYKITDESDRKTRSTYEVRFRKKKLILRKKFLNMDGMLPKFAIKKISRSQKNSHYRYIKLEGEVNKNLLTKTYYNLVRGKKTSDYGSLFLRANYSLKAVSYSEMGIDNENDFEGEVTKNWLEWFNKNKPINIANTEVLDQDKIEKLNSYLKLPSEVMMNNIPDVFVNSLLLDIEVNITKKKFNEKLREYTFQYEGFAYLKDLQTNLVVGAYKFDQTYKTYKITPGISIANLVANHVYHMAKGSFPEINTNIKDISPISTIKRISLTEFKNIRQVDSLLKLFRSRGIKYSLKTKLESISLGRADVIVYFDGDYDEVKSLFLSLQSAKKDLSFELIDTDNVLGIKFISVVENI